MPLQPIHLEYDLISLMDAVLDCDTQALCLHVARLAGIEHDGSFT